ncbi:MAG: FAD-dependent oxidoreductase [Micropruina sp.]
MQRPGPKERLDEQFDLIVIGGGITGVATARDAALRGLSVLLVESEDFAAGTSSRSSKLIHGVCGTCRPTSSAWSPSRCGSGSGC